MWLLLKGPTGHLRSHGQHVNNFLISEYLAADLSADASADALGRINISYFCFDNDKNFRLTRLCFYGKLSDFFPNLIFRFLLYMSGQIALFDDGNTDCTLACDDEDPF